MFWASEYKFASLALKFEFSNLPQPDMLFNLSISQLLKYVYARQRTNYSLGIPWNSIVTLSVCPFFAANVAPVNPGSIPTATIVSIQNAAAQQALQTRTSVGGGVSPQLLQLQASSQSIMQVLLPVLSLGPLPHCLQFADLFFFWLIFFSCRKSSESCEHFLFFAFHFVPSPKLYSIWLVSFVFFPISSLWFRMHAIHCKIITLAL